MKTIYLLGGLALIIFASCSTTSHVPCMPSEPMFTGPLQAQTSVGLSLNHYEAQGAVSILPCLGLTGDYYRGIKGTQQFEIGVNLFSPLNKNKTWFVSLGVGKGQGNFNDKHKPDLFSTYLINSNFNSFYIQPSIYYVNNKSKEFTYKVCLAFKHEEIFFKHFNTSFKNKSGLDYGTYTIYAEKINGYAITQTPFLGFTVEPKNNFVFIQSQIGYSIITKKFHAPITRYEGGGGAYYNSGLIKDATHPHFNPFMLNITVGLKLDCFNVKNKK